MIKKIKKQMISILLLSLAAYVLAACGHAAESRSAGEGLSDEGYELLLRETENISEFWLSQPRQKASDLLQVALENIDIDKDSIHKMAGILSECYSSPVSAKPHSADAG